MPFVASWRILYAWKFKRITCQLWASFVAYSWVQVDSVSISLAHTELGQSDTFSLLIDLSPLLTHNCSEGYSNSWATCFPFFMHFLIPQVHIYNSIAKIPWKTWIGTMAFSVQNATKSSILAIYTLICILNKLWSC